jgi:NarL family two-component system response regulator LiaR
VEDQAVIRITLARWIGAEPDIEVIDAVERGEEALRIVEECAPDVVLLDLVLDTSQIEGIETLRRIRAISPATQVVVLSAYSDDAYVLPALEAEAIGYMLKRSDPDEVLEAIRDATRDRHHIDPIILARLVEKARKDQNPDELKPELTRREKELVRLIARGMTNAEIAQQTYLSIATVKTHVSNILRKLGIANRQQIIRLVARDDPRLK